MAHSVYTVSRAE